MGTDTYFHGHYLCGDIYSIYMPRIARVVTAEHPQHITQTRYYRQKIFAFDNDRRKYLLLLKEESKRHHLIILAYCLMSNHLHFIAVPERENYNTQVQKYFAESIKTTPCEKTSFLIILSKNKKTGRNL